MLFIRTNLYQRSSATGKEEEKKNVIACANPWRLRARLIAAVSKNRIKIIVQNVPSNILRTQHYWQMELGLWKLRVTLLMRRDIRKKQRQDPMMLFTVLTVLRTGDELGA